MTIRENLLAEYRAATHLERSLTQEAAKATDKRTQTLRALHTSGMSYATIGDAVGLSWQRVQQIAKR